MQIILEEQVLFSTFWKWDYSLLCQKKALTWIQNQIVYYDITMELAALWSSLKPTKMKDTLSESCYFKGSAIV